MSSINRKVPEGVLRDGWSEQVADYAIAGGWTPSGEELIVGDSAGGVSGFEGKSGTLKWSQPAGHRDGVLAISMRPNSKEFASAGQDGRLIIWDALDGKAKYIIDCENGWVENVAWSTDGQWLAASCSRQVRIYRFDGEEVWRSEDHPSTVSAIAWSGSEEVATACYGRVAFFDREKGALNQKLEWKGSLISMILSPDGDIVVCGSQDNSVHFWRRSTAQDSMMGGYDNKPSALAFDESGTFLATGGSSAVTVWSFSGGGPEGTRPGLLELHTQGVTKVKFSNRGMRLASTARDRGVVVWSLKQDGTGEAIGTVNITDKVAELYWRPDGRALAALDAGGGVSVWRVR